jgi:hypothetical protein
MSATYRHRVAVLALPGFLGAPIVIMVARVAANPAGMDQGRG